MADVKNCPDCKVEMDEGFMPDFAFNAVIQLLWHPGKAQSQTILGMSIDSLKLDQSQCIPLTAHRCPESGLVRTYANKQGDD